MKCNARRHFYFNLPWQTHLKRILSFFSPMMYAGALIYLIERLCHNTMLWENALLSNSCLLALLQVRGLKNWHMRIQYYCKLETHGHQLTQLKFDQTNYSDIHEANSCCLTRRYNIINCYGFICKNKYIRSLFKKIIYKYIANNIELLMIFPLIFIHDNMYYNVTST